MTDILDYISTWSALKWVVLVLIAGFIGQFGRMMAEAIMVKLRRRRETKQVQMDIQPSEVLPSIPPQTSGGAPREAQPVLPPQMEPSSLPVASGEGSDKKRLKAMAKARKKEAKKSTNAS